MINPNHDKTSLRNRLIRHVFRKYPIAKGRYRFMMLAKKALNKRKLEIITDLHGKYKFALDLSDDDLQSSFYYFMPEFYEHETQKYIGEFVKPGMTVIDIGAHLGLLSLLFADKVGETGRVYSFEPTVENFLKLQFNIDLNSLTQVKAIQKAISNKTGTANLAHSLHSSGHFLSEANPVLLNNFQSEKIVTTTLDTFIEENHLEKIDLIKIDAEKSEHLILEGARHTLELGMARNIICEIHSSHNKSNVGHDRIRHIFYSYGYKSYILNSALSKRKYLAELKPNEPIIGLQNILFKL